MNQSCFYLEFPHKILFGSSLHFVGMRIFIEGYEMEYEKSFFSTKQGALVSHFRDWDESRVLVANY